MKKKIEDGKADKRLWQCCRMLHCVVFIQIGCTKSNSHFRTKLSTPHFFLFIFQVFKHPMYISYM